MIDTRYAPYGILLLRISAGIAFIAHALLKALVFGMPGAVKFFASIGFPGWLAYVAVAFELVGGAMLILGVYGRQVALILGLELLVASSAHWHNGWFFAAKGGGWEYPVFWAMAMFALVLLGDGAHSLVPSGAKRA
jgi:putative oxidoreductase